MSKTILLALTNPVTGREQEFVSWYKNEHLKDVLAVPGVESAQFHRISGAPVSARKVYSYAAVYEVEHVSPYAVVEEIVRRSKADEMLLSDAMDEDFYCVLYDPISDKLRR